MATPAITPLQAVIQNRAKLQALPPAAQEKFANYVFRKFLLPQLVSKGTPDEFVERARKQFTTRLLTGEQKPLDDTPTTKMREQGGQSTGLTGVLEGGLMEGLSNIAKAGEKISHLPGGGGDRSAAALRNSSEELHEVGDINKTASKEYSDKNPVKSFAVDMAGQAAPAIPFGMAAGGAAVAAGARGLIPAAAAGAADMQSFDPGMKGAVVGAATPYVAKGLGKVAGKIAAPVINAVKGGMSKIPARAASTTSGLGSEFVQGLEKKAQAEFKKPFVELLPDQKAKIVNAAREEAVAAETVARSEKAKAAKEAKIATSGEEAQLRIKAEKAKLDAKLTTKVEKDRLRDEAKQVAAGAAAFRKLMKRAPTEEELTKIREAVKNGPKSASSPEPTPVAAAPAASAPPPAQSQPQAAAAAAPAKAPVVEVPKPVVPQPERRAEVRSDTSRMVLNKLHGELRIETDPIKKNEIQAAILRETKLGHPEEAFKAESPEAIKAAEAFSSFAKDPTTGITKVPEGVHGSGFEANKDALKRVDQVIDKPDAATKLEAVKADPVGEGKKGKNADRKAVERATAAAKAALPTHMVGVGDETLAGIEKVASNAKTPEDRLIALETAFDFAKKHLDNGDVLVKAFKSAAKLQKWSTEETIENMMQAFGKLNKEGKFK